MSNPRSIISKYTNKGDKKFRGKANYYTIDASKNHARLTFDLRVLQRTSNTLSFDERFDAEKVMEIIRRKRDWNERHPNFDLKISRERYDSILEESA